MESGVEIDQLGISNAIKIATGTRSSAGITTQHCCKLCHRRYKRIEHLRRHLTSHDSVTNKQRCDACLREFTRSDALKRHIRTCTARTTEIAARSRARACDRCIQVKTACDTRRPCKSCLEKDVPCSYSRCDIGSASSPNAKFEAAPGTRYIRPAEPLDLDTNSFTGNLGLSFDMFDFASTTWADFLTMQPDPQVDASDLKLSFLDNFTKHTGLLRSFDCATPEMRIACLQRAELAMQQDQIFDQFCLLDETDHMMALSRSIVDLVCEVAIIKPRNSIVDLVWSDALREQCLKFFSPVRIQIQLELFWSIWHPNVNILHRATFNATKAKPNLVAAMTIMGALVSPDEVVSKDARTWLNAIEEIVFVDNDLYEDVHVSHEFPPTTKIQNLQAAYIVCLYQNWEGTNQSKQRIRRHRFNAMVACTRDIGIHNAVHINCKSFKDFDYADFAAREQLIRVFLWIFLLDTAFVIFNNVPPRMVIREMVMHTASSEDVFQAQTAVECFELFHHQEAECFDHLHDTRSLYRAAEILCIEEFDEHHTSSLARLGPLNLFAITSSLHSMLFQFQNGFCTEGQLGPLRNALENWKSVWAVYMDTGYQSGPHNPIGGDALTARNMWKRVGFFKHASEYWLLASLLLDRICIARHQQQEHARQVSKNTKSSVENPLPAVLHRYDETSMQQVNDLINDFQRTSLHDD